MKEFLVYTGLRIALFAATLGVVLGIWLLVAGTADVFFSVIIAFVVSGIGSYVLLNGPRERFAQRVDDLERGRLPEAVHHCRRALEREPNDSDTMMMMCVS